MSAPKTIYIRHYDDNCLSNQWALKPNKLRHLEYRLAEECKWVRVFDGHFNVGCVMETGERANSAFYPRFKFCPFCGGRIVIEGD